jgi:hypothetical protein
MRNYRRSKEIPEDPFKISSSQFKKENSNPLSGKIGETKKGFRMKKQIELNLPNVCAKMKYLNSLNAINMGNWLFISIDDFIETLETIKERKLNQEPN